MKNTIIFLVSLFLVSFSQNSFSQAKKLDKQVLKTMKTATRFMMDEVSYKGGFVWNYLPDFSRSWGEMEAKRTMIWIQPPGTPTMGHILLDAYHATGDEYYYESAKRVANALIHAQHPSGGWNYVFDFAGEKSLKQWYETIGKNGWRLEEFQHYYGNATFDDAGTIQAGKFLLRFYIERKENAIFPALEKTIRFVLESQYPVGGWPQRYPLKSDFSKNGLPDYTSFITLNDDVMVENIDFLVLCYQALGRKDLKEPILRAMYCFSKLQQDYPYPGWSDQYTLDLKPAYARTYEPCAISMSTTAESADKMMDYYMLTGDTAFLAGIPAAMEFIESQKLPDSEVLLSGKKLKAAGDFMVPRFIDPTTGNPLYTHRKGTNVVNGQYFVNQDIQNTLGHYSSLVSFNLSKIRLRYEEMRKLPVDVVTKGSPLLEKHAVPLPVYFTKDIMQENPTDRTAQIVSELNKEGYWSAPLTSCSNPYIGSGPKEGSEETKYAGTMVGDEFDTSCYPGPENATCISTGVYIMNMFQLIKYIDKSGKK